MTVGELLDEVVVALARLGGSARQLEDVQALVELAGPALDRAYIEGWLRMLEVEVEWQAIQDAIDP